MGDTHTAQSRAPGPRPGPRPCPSMCSRATDGLQPPGLPGTRARPPPGMLLIAKEIPSGTHGKTSENEQGQTRSRPWLAALCPASRPGPCTSCSFRRGKPSSQADAAPPATRLPSSADGGPRKRCPQQPVMVASLEKGSVHMGPSEGPQGEVTLSQVSPESHDGVPTRKEGETQPEDPEHTGRDRTDEALTPEP